MASITLPVSRLFAWWIAELRGLLPEATARATPDNNHLIVEVRDTEYRLVGRTRRNGTTSSSEPIPLSSSQLLEALRISTQGKKNPVVDIRIPYSACFVRNVFLPAGAARDYSRLLAIDLERSTPFKRRDFYTGYITTERHPGGRQGVRQLVVKRQLIDGIKSEIEKLGIRVGAIKSANEAESAFVTLTSEEDDRIQKSQRGYLGIVLALVSLAVVLAFLAEYLAVRQHDAALSDLQAETAQLRMQAQGVTESKDKYQASVAAIGEFNKLRKNQISRAAILEELSRVLPDTAWVTDLKIRGVTVDVAGLASSANSIVPILEKSPMFVDATLVAPLAFDPLQNKERFGVRMRLEGVAGEQEKLSEDAQ